jgi:hypothetical protein
MRCLPVLLLFLLPLGCSHGHALRLPVGQGVVTVLGSTEITLDGKASYPLAPEVRTVSTYTEDTVPAILAIGNYVELFSTQRRVSQVRIIGPVIPGSSPNVAYIGSLVAVDGAWLLFADGTVLRKAINVRVHPSKRAVVVRIDPKSHEILTVNAS